MQKVLLRRRCDVGQPADDAGRRVPVNGMVAVVTTEDRMLDQARTREVEVEVEEDAEDEG